MIKFSNEIDIKGSALLLSFTSVGLTGNFASSILINNNNFESIGFLFSHYLAPYVTINPETNSTMYNGQIYFNQEKKIVLINFHAGVPHHFRNEFCKELLDIHQNYAMRGFLIYGGIGKGYINDEELRRKVVGLYYLTNDDTFEGSKLNMKSFESLVKLENKK